MSSSVAGFGFEVRLMGKASGLGGFSVFRISLGPSSHSSEGFFEQEFS